MRSKEGKEWCKGEESKRNEKENDKISHKDLSYSLLHSFCLFSHSSYSSYVLFLTCRKNTHTFLSTYNLHSSTQRHSDTSPSHTAVSRAKKEGEDFLHTSCFFLFFSLFFLCLQVKDTHIIYGIESSMPYIFILALDVPSFILFFLLESSLFLLDQSYNFIPCSLPPRVSFYACHTRLSRVKSDKPHLHTLTERLQIRDWTLKAGQKLESLKVMKLREEEMRGQSACASSSQDWQELHIIFHCEIHFFPLCDIPSFMKGNTIISSVFYFKCELFIAEIFYSFPYYSFPFSLPW